ncbi:hypothetical protein GmHk_20G057838 [Glycine max]|nr:hypothetical protein GmHk_20G057838 [Glycine max]
MADAKHFAAREDHLEAAMAKLATTQLRLESILDALLLKLPSRTNHHHLSSSSVQSPLPPPPSRLTAPSYPVPMQHNQSPLPTPLPTLTPLTMPPPSSMPTPPPPPAFIQPYLTPLSAPLPIAFVPLLANSNPHASSDRHWITIPQVRKEYPSRCKELDHSFLFYAIIDTAKWLDFHNTNLHSLIPSSILIWDPDSNLKP